MATSEHDKARMQWQRYQFMLDSGHREFVTRADENEGFYLGTRQWDPIDEQALKEKMMPCETINEILPKINNLVGEQIQTRTDITVKPRDMTGDEETAKIMAKVLKQIQQANRMKDMITDVVEDGYILSRGFIDMTVEFNQPGMPGDIKAKKKHPKTILVDPFAFSYDPEDWHDFIETSWSSYNDIKAMFGRKKAEELEAKQIGSADDTYGFDSIRPWGFAGEDLKGKFIGDNELIRELPIIRVNSRQFREWSTTRWFIDPATRESSEVPYEWDDDRVDFVAKNSGVLVVKLPHRRVRHRITGDDVMLFDKWSIYRSFTIVPFFPMFRWGQPLSVVDNLKGPQRVVNKTASQQLHIINNTANSGWMVEEGSLVNMDIDDLKQHGASSGLALEYKKGSNMPEKIKPNPLSQGLDRLEFLAKENIKSISTVNDSRLGDDREDVAAKAIVAKQQRGAVNSARYKSNEERTQYLLGRKMIELIQGFYTEPRILRITGRDPVSNVQTSETVSINQPTPEGVILNDLTIGEYDLVVSTMPNRDNLQEVQFEEATRMKEMGVQLPDSVLIRNSALEDKEEIAKAMQEDPLAQQMKQAELLETKMDIVDTLAGAKKKDAETQKIMTEVRNPEQGDTSGPSDSEKFQADRLMKFITAADNAEIKRISQRGKTNAG